MPIQNTTIIQKSIKLGAILLVVLLALILMMVPDTAETQAANVQPALIALAAEQPEAQVRVILQKSDPDANIEAAITHMDGTVIKDLHILNAVVADMKAETAVDIAHDASVNWVSLDNLVEQSGKPPKDQPSDALPANY